MIPKGSHHSKNQSPPLHRKPRLSKKDLVPQSIWPELIGKTAEEAKNELIKNGMPLHVEIIDLEHSTDLTLEYQAYRVQIFVDEDGRVPYAPQLG
jgi:hypothetical protein